MFARVGLCISTLALIASLAPAAAQDDPLAWWPFDDAEGLLAQDVSGNVLDADVLGARWARGPFGSALWFDGEQSTVSVPQIPGLDGSDALSLSAWVYWEGTGQYPNIITGGRWSPGGFMFFVSNDTCHFRMGRPGHAANTPGQQWREVSAPLVSGIETGRWYHLAATFERPTITTYLDGVEVGSATWDYPVGYSGELLIGCWYPGRGHHAGLIDDVRIWTRALGADEVARLHATTADGRETPAEGAAYELLPEVGQEGAPMVFEADDFSLSLDRAGRAVSLLEKGTGRELLGAPQPFARATVEGRQIEQMQCSREGDRLAITFGRGGPRVVLAVESRGSHLAFEVLEADESIESLTLLRLHPQGMTMSSPMSGCANDGEVGVCVRALTMDTRCWLGGSPLGLWAMAGEDDYPIVGTRAGLVCCHMDRMLPNLRRLVRSEDVPQSDLGGPWALEAERNLGSYLFANVTEANVDDWIALAKRGGFTIIHFSGWWQNLGHYEPRESSFPGGMAGLKECVRRVHEAGLLAGMHTLTGCIDTRDPWVTPVPDQRLAADAKYTLARAMDEQADTIFITQKPQQHDTIWSYSGGGNVIRIGEELVMYSGISFEEPYAFTGCTRGAFNTVPSAHPEGAAADHLRQRYLAFYPDENSTLVGEVADNIARVCNECGFDQLYQDGSEGIGGWHPMAVIRTAIYERLDHPVIIEASAWGHWSWYFHSRVGAWDHSKWGLKPSMDMHCDGIPTYREGALLQAQLGWWAVNAPGPAWRAEMPDEMEYFCAKVLAHEAPMSLQGIGQPYAPANKRMREYLTMTGQYERLRLAGYFDDRVLARLRREGEDYHLRQAADGVWEFAPRTYDTHLVTGLEDGSDRWTVVNAGDAQPLGLRITALFGAEAYDGDRGVVIEDFADPGVFSVNRDAPNVTHMLEAAAESAPSGEAAVAFSATNAGGERVGAWAHAGRRFAPHLKLGAADALGVWVRGDGSGALLNIQLTCPPAWGHAYADNYVRLDFDGWRYVELLLRERDPSVYRAHRWPYSAGHSVLRRALVRDQVNELNLYLNDLPAGATSTVMLGPIRGLPTVALGLEEVSLTVGGERLDLPVPLYSGGYIEVDPDGVWRSYDARCELLERGNLAAPPPTLASGISPVGLDCREREGRPGRAEVVIISEGRPLRGMAPRDEIDRAQMRYEYVMPRIVTDLDGRQDAFEVICREGEEATLGAEIAVVRGAGSVGAYESPEALTLESFDDDAFFTADPANEFAKYVHDGEHRGVSTKPGVSAALLPEAETVHVGARAARYTATSERDDNTGWSAHGRRFAEPLDLTEFGSLGVWVHGDGKGEVIKFQLRDTEGGWLDMTEAVNWGGWRYLEFDLAGDRIDLSRVEYIIIYYNSIPAGQTVTCYVDDLRALPRAEAVREASLALAGSTLTFPVALYDGDRILWDGGLTCRVVRGNGESETLPVEGSLPRLQPGVNAVHFAHASAGEGAQIEVALVKDYR